MTKSGFARLASDGAPVAFARQLPASLQVWWRDNQNDLAGLQARGYAAAEEVTPNHDPRTHVVQGGAWDTEASPMTFTRAVVAIDPGDAADAERRKRLTMAHGEIDQIRRAVVPPLESQDATYGLKLVFALLATHGSAAMKAAVKPLIEAEATPMGQTEAELTPAVIAQGVAWSTANETMEGMRRAFETALDAATTVAELDAIADPDFGPIRTALGLTDPV